MSDTDDDEVMPGMSILEQMAEMEHVAVEISNSMADESDVIQAMTQEYFSRLAGKPVSTTALIGFGIQLVLNGCANAAGAQDGEQDDKLFQAFARACSMLIVRMAEERKSTTEELVPNDKSA